MVNSILFIDEKNISNTHDSSSYHLDYIINYSKIDIIRPKIIDGTHLSELDRSLHSDKTIVAAVIPYFLTSNEEAMTDIQDAFDYSEKTFAELISGKSNRDSESYQSANKNIGLVIRETGALVAPDMISHIRNITDKTFPIILYSNVPHNPIALDSQVNGHGSGPCLYYVSKGTATNYLNALLGVFVNGPDKFSKLGLPCRDYSDFNDLGEVISVNLIDKNFDIFVNSLPKELIPKYTDLVRSLKSNESTREWRARYNLATTMAIEYQQAGMSVVAEDFYPRPPEINYFN